MLAALLRWVGFIACWIWSGKGALGMAPSICWLPRPRLPVLSNLAGPVQHFKSAILNAWRDKAAADLCAREGFRAGPLLDIAGTLQLLNSSQVRDQECLGWWCLERVPVGEDAWTACSMPVLWWPRW